MLMTNVGGKTDRKDSNNENPCAEIFLSAASFKQRMAVSKYFIRAYKLLFITRNIMGLQ